MQEYAKYIAQLMLYTFWGVSERTVVLCPETVREFEESLRKGKLVKKLEIFSMNNKTIIEFGFRITWRITEISECVIRRGRDTLLDLHNSS